MINHTMTCSWLKKCLCGKKRWKNRIICGIAVVVTLYLCLCASQRLAMRDTSLAGEECMLYYIVNADGMKGLGHSILLVVDEEGCGRVFSFNGMQRTLGESLLGKSGIGKMSVGTMTAEETEAFLQTGDLKLDGDQLADNYDMALYRPISSEEYQMILAQLAPYFEAEKQFAELYEKWVREEDRDRKAEYEQTLEQLGREEGLPLYQLYTHNCDQAARLLAAPIDPVLQDYTQHSWRVTPNGNLKAFGQRAESWGVMTLGRLSFSEKMLMFLVIF